MALPVCGDAEYAAECDRVFGEIWADVVRRMTVEAQHVAAEFSPGFSPATISDPADAP